MAGHSKWANIKRRKGAQDAKRSKIFTKLIKEITVAAKEGGEDPDANPRLRLAINNAKGANMPKDTIERAVQKGSGADSENYTEASYEGYATHGVAVFVETMTDNINRTVANVRSAFSKNGGSLGTNGSLEFIFDRKGIFNFKLPDGADIDQLTLEIIDAGAEEVEVEDGYMHLSCAMEDFGAVQRKLDDLNIEAENAELQRIPQNRIPLNDEAFEEVYKLIEVLEDDDDVQKVYHNIDATDEQMERM
ncbi:YebC/PmpR family DNA-binding transcriptional regulator [Nafulsella turpanensis]|uniref:YebC/PmpR family DNA-binding transcriptional regulator n=1 Tax=Nafulsella turpanensis TaxID=1265690 RepID=UPI000347E64A|nr:YebC/PmpR family DNA-binding transcriptional regulator [Nafulsella turpanensis]